MVVRFRFGFCFGFDAVFELNSAEVCVDATQVAIAPVLLAVAMVVVGGSGDEVVSSIVAALV